MPRTSELIVLKSVSASDRRARKRKPTTSHYVTAESRQLPEKVIAMQILMRKRSEAIKEAGLSEHKSYVNQKKQAAYVAKIEACLREAGL